MTPVSSPPPVPLPPSWLPWLIAAILALGAGWFYLEATAARQEAESLRLQLDLRELELRDARNRREGERLLLNRQIETGRSPSVAAPSVAAPSGAATKN